uniref:PiggyBac transposable element-derived protein domain-containing protein n=1 Tax=Ditylenchus dipsaci TaxID=166011 RepID=A0A915EA44_9BILA
MSEESSAASSESIDYEEDSDYDLDEDKCMETTEIENAAEESYLVGTVEHVTFAHKGTKPLPNAVPCQQIFLHIFDEAPSARDVHRKQTNHCKFLQPRKIRD